MKIKEKGLVRSISVSIPVLKRNSKGKGTKKRPKSDPGQNYNIGRSKAISRSSPKIPTPPPLPPPAKNLTYRPKSRTPTPKDALELNEYKIYDKKINPIGFTFLSGNGPNRANYLYDIEKGKEYNRNSKALKKLQIYEITSIEKKNDELRKKYAKEHGITLKLNKKLGGSKTHRNKKPYKKTKRNNRRCVTRKYTGHKKRMSNK